jgi:hypothetical protein
MSMDSNIAHNGDSLDPLPIESLEDFEKRVGHKFAPVQTKTAIRAAPGARAVAFKSAFAFCSEYVPLAYTIEGIVRSSALYSMTAPTGAGKTAFNVVAALAVATGRADILGRAVAHGRVAYLAFENPDDVRMRIMIAAFLLDVDIYGLGDHLVILDRREKPEAVHAELSRLAKTDPFALILVDTLAAFFDGDNINDAVKGGEFMRRLRPLTQIAGLPAVVISAASSQECWHGSARSIRQRGDLE